MNENVCKYLIPCRKCNFQPICGNQTGNRETEGCCNHPECKELIRCWRNEAGQKLCEMYKEYQDGL